MRVRLLVVLTAAVFGLLAAFAGGALAQQATIASISPNFGPVTGGTTVVITGDYIFDAMPRPVMIGGANATFVSQQIVNQGPTAKITVTTPPGTFGPADVVIYAYAGGPEIVRKAGGFTYKDLAVTSVAPAAGLTTGEETITIAGAGFSGGSTPAVTMGGTPATDVTVVNDATLKATTPAHLKGTVDVVVSRDGRQVTASGAYTFNQGYWLTVTARRPNLSAVLGGGLDPIGAIRTRKSATAWFGDWSQQDGYQYFAYSGGINCGARSVADTGYQYWEGGPCRYAFAADTPVSLAALPSSYNRDMLKFAFLSAWGGDCPASLKGDSCSLSMTADRNVLAAWGYFGFANGLTTGGASLDVVEPNFQPDGSMQYWQTSFRVTGEAAVGGAPTFSIVAFAVKTAASRQSATAVRTGPVACRASARISGGRMRATCPVTPAVSRALAKGSVRLTTRWYAHLPHQSRAVLIRSGHALLRGRRTSAITG